MASTTAATTPMERTCLCRSDDDCFDPRMIMITLSEAREVFAQLVTPDEELIWDKNHIETTDWWVIFFNTRAYYETGDPFFGLVGNGRLVVPKSGSTRFDLGTGVSVEKQIADAGQEIIFSSFAQQDDAD